MAALEAYLGVPFFVAGSLFLLAGALLAAGRRRSEDTLLAVFLAMVATNFLAHAMASMTSDGRWLQVAWIALALDPLYLLAFVTAYPYPRRTRQVNLLILALVGLSSFSIYGYIFEYERIFFSLTGDDPRSPEHLLTIAGMMIAYLVAWILAVQGAVSAPTPTLAKRARWTVLAVGIAVVPRPALLPLDVGLEAPIQTYLTPGLAISAFGLLLSLAFFLAGAAFARNLEPLRRSATISSLRLTGLVVSALLIARFALDVAGSGGATYSLRWLAFSGLLVYGMLTFEIIEVRSTSDRVVPAIVAGLTGLLAFLGGLVLDVQAGPALGAAAAGGALGGLTARALVRRFLKGPGGGHDRGHRLELYRAALEAAWAAGPPSPEVRKRLDRERRAFGVSYEEARTLEHVVTSLVAGWRGVSPGDEPLPGLLVERVIGEGTHGKVFLATQHTTGRRVIVKELRAEVLGQRESRRRFRDEVRALEQLHHPNIARLLDTLSVGNRHMLVMEHVDGRPLSDLLEKGPLSEARTRLVISDLLDALETAHAHGVVHRDIKPSNILMRSDGRCVLTDFGVAVTRPTGESAKATVASLDGLTELAGTVAYMAPEQARGERVGPAADLYAVGLVAFECLTGTAALDVKGCGALEALQRAANPEVDWEAVPPAWQVFLRRAMNPDPAQRHPSAAAMMEAMMGRRA